MNTAEKLNSRVWRISMFAVFLCFAVAGGLLVSSLAKAGTNPLALNVSFTQTISLNHTSSPGG